ncbi:hypothetical protein [Methylobacterium sp. J-070]|uniref:hypothetical protein n=1 Tax=Methylobacterium sp. J-070 TaxID=2836650 RepID=UPI001FBA50DF|nr:hypothetical protein [Methylobacterium sp. J-070]MCJ2054776.1 hypothetical protein [Methylobacterium sp. J-070]
MSQPAASDLTPTGAFVLGLVQSIERREPGAPAAIAFRTALARKGREICAADGVGALDILMRAIAATDLGRAAERTALLRAVWTDFLPRSDKA